MSEPPGLFDLRVEDNRPLDMCADCRRPLDLRKPHVTVNWHVEKIGIFGWIKVLDCQVVRVFCLDCGARHRS